MTAATDYRIENIRSITYNGKNVRSFDAYVKQADGSFVFQGAFTAPARTAKKSLWIIANESDAGAVEE